MIHTSESAKNDHIYEAKWPLIFKLKAEFDFKGPHGCIQRRIFIMNIISYRLRVTEGGNFCTMWDHVLALKSKQTLAD